MIAPTPGSNWALTDPNTGRRLHVRVEAINDNGDVVYWVLNPGKRGKRVRMMRVNRFVSLAREEL